MSSFADKGGMFSLKDVAAVAGVSIRTVNRVLKKDGYASEATQKRVLDAAARLGYRPNLAARALKTGRSLEISAILGPLDQLHVEKLAAFEQTLRKAAYSVHVLFGPGERIPSAEVERVLRDSVERRPAAVAVFPQSFLPAYKVQAYFESLDIPHVFLDPMERDGIDAIWIDRQQGVYEAVKYLSEQGRRRIAYLGVTVGHPGDPLFFASGTRFEGYERAVREIGQPPVVLPVDLSTDQFEGGKEAVEAFMRLSPRPDAVQTFTDDMAMGFLAGLHERGRRVPEEVSVVGFNDCHYARLAWPPLSSIAQPLKEVGEAAARVLLAKLNGEPPPETGWSKYLPTKLVLRRTT